MAHKLNEIATEFLTHNDACQPGYEWAVENCATLREIYDTARPDWVVWLLTREGVLTDRELWLFACHVAEQSLPNWYEFAPDDHRPKIAIETRRKWLDGLATDEDLSAAESAAGSAWSAAGSAWSAEACSAESAAESAWSAAESAWSAAGSAESAAESAWSAAGSAESAAGSAWSAAGSAWSAAARSAWSAAGSAWSAAARSARSAAARSAQLEWLRANTNPKFVDEV